MSVSFSYNPTPSTPLGFMAKVIPSWAGRPRAAPGRCGARRRWRGCPRAAAHPAAVGTSEYGRDYRLGYGMTVAERGAMSFELGVDAHRRESPAQVGAGHGVGGRLMARW